jgi:endonuclease I
MLFFKKLTLAVALLVSFSISISAQIPPNYYNNAQGLTGVELKSALYNIIKNHTVLSYADLWSAFYHTDRKPNGKVWDMYSDKPGQTPPYEYTFYSDQCGNYGGEGDCYNREHSMPKSWYNDATPMYTDLFHLVPTDGYVNGMRSNYPFGEVGTANWTSLNGSKRGNSNFPGYTGIVFEPIDAYKGDFARAYFYMVTRYHNIVANWNSDMLNHTSYPAFTEWAKELLIKWHNEDPVSQKEIDRNNVIYSSYQGNRNPFVDYPEFVDLIWGDAELTLSFTSVPGLLVYEDNLYNYNAVAQLNSIAKYDITLTAEQKPLWLNFSMTGNGAGTLTGTPSNADIGEHDVILKATYQSQTVYQNFTIEVLAVIEDNNPPIIGDISIDPEFPYDFESVSVFAEITDPENDNLYADLKWGLVSDNLINTIEMTESESIFSATIPANESGTTVYFKIIATDEPGNKTESSVYNYSVLHTGINNIDECLADINISSTIGSKQLTVRNYCFNTESISIYSVTGQLVHHQTIEEGNNISINTSNLNSGVYIMKLTGKTQQKSIKFIISNTR